MNAREVLQDLEKMLKNEQFECTLKPDFETPPYGTLLAFLGNDRLGRERILEITVQLQDLGESLQDPPSPPQFSRIQFELKLPFTIMENATVEVATLLAFLNRMLELPGFELDEVNSNVYYRYVLLTSQKGTDKKLITGIIGVILMLIELFSGTIEQVAAGKSSFNDLFEEMLQLTETMGG
jgi:hypothetical protein